MRSQAIALLLAGLIALSGCASVSVEQAKDLSSAGIEYSKATAAVIDLAVDAAIDASSYRLVSVAASRAKDETEAADRIKSLTERDAILVGQVKIYTDIKRSAGAVEAYFTGLQELSGATPGDAVETSVKTLADRINGISSVLEQKVALNGDRKDAVAGFAKFFVKQAHGAAVARALERDTEIIGRALVLQEISLQVARSELDEFSNEQWARFHAKRVLDPYAAGGVNADWIKDRRDYVKAQAIGSAGEAVRTAEQAARQMQGVWARILSGSTSGAELKLMLRDVNEALDAATALKTAF